MTMKKNVIQKLVLNRETLRRLEDGAGGGPGWQLLPSATSMTAACTGEPCHTCATNCPK